MGGRRQQGGLSSLGDANDGKAIVRDSKPVERCAERLQRHLADARGLAIITEPAQRHCGGTVPRQQPSTVDFDPATRTRQHQDADAVAASLRFHQHTARPSRTVSISAQPTKSFI
jgi:hypothetical protein